MKLTDLKAEFGKYYVLRDRHVLDIMLASIISNLLLKDDPVWLQIIAPSSAGKTTLLAPIRDIPKIHFIDDLTPNTFLSGFNVKGKNMSMLHIIGSGVMAFSDFTNILSKNKEALGEILSQLKLVCDGNFSKYTGTGKVTPWTGKMGFCGCSTPDIYHYLESGRSMGERFIYYWMNPASDFDISSKQSEVKVSSREVTDIMKELYKEYYEAIQEWINLHGIPELKILPEQRLKIQEAASFCVNGKATVHTNFKTGMADQIPNKASVGRDNKMFDAILHACQIMDAFENENPYLPVQDSRIEMVRKCAYSALNRERRKILEILAKEEVPITASAVGAKKGLGFSRTSVEMYLTPLHAVGMIQKQINTGAHKWFIGQDSIRKFIKEVSPYIVEEELINLDQGLELLDEEAVAEDAFAGY